MQTQTSEQQIALDYDYTTAAEYLGISRRQLQRAVRAGRCERIKLGLRVSFSRTQLDNYVSVNSGFHVGVAR